MGILGGSFNPAHEGHREISLWALDRLGLDKIWWMVSPQNPLKPVAGMAPFKERLALARAAARHPKIEVTDIERRLGSRYTAETLPALVERYPEHRFVWLMGADNLIQIDRWQDWQRIFNTLPVAVFSRPSYSMRALAGKAARRFAKARLPGPRARELAETEPPSWVFIHGPANRQSASEIRARTRSAATIDAATAKKAKRTGGRRMTGNAGATRKG
ncbi:MAG: nicotinate-nucleotide adenylyltransferase [Dongiaceae bacterium]